MGGAVSVSAAGGDQSLWTPLEAAENAKTLEVQNLFTGFVAQHFFHGLPIRAGKQSSDPLSALWLEVNAEELEELEKINGEGYQKVGKVRKDKSFIRCALPSLLNINSWC